MIAIHCPGCGKTLKVKDEVAGKKVKCPGCGQVLRVGALAGGDAGAPVNRGEKTLASLPAGGPSTPLAKEDAPTLPPAEPPSRLKQAGGPTRGDTVEEGDPSEGSELTAFLAPPQAGDEIGRLGPYRVLKVLGVGGMGVVFQAEDPQLQRPVALKAMLPSLAAVESSRRRFLREARAAAALKHDHVVTIHQVGEDRGAPFLAMEFLEGEPLDARLKRQPPPSLGESLRIARQTAEGLAAAHERGLVHRDIKPANLWLEKPKGRVKILDFGLARGGAEQSQLTQDGAIVGTPAYMAPEQARGEKLDARADLFSLGCVLYRLTTGELPFKGTDTVSTLVAVATDAPVPPHDLDPGIPPELSDLVLWLLAKDPGKRPRSASEVVEALASLQGGSIRTEVLPKPALSHGRAKKASGGAKKRAGLIVGAALLVALAVGGVGVYFATRPPDSRKHVKEDKIEEKDKDKKDRDKGSGKGGPKPPEVPAGAPLSPLALVSRPPAIEGVESWSIEPTGHRGPVAVTACSSDSKRLASGGDDGTVRLWTPDTGVLLRVLLGHGQGVKCLAWSPDGKRLASGGDDHTIRLWEADTGKTLRTLTRHTGPVRVLAWSPDGKTLASGGDDRSVQLWDPDSGETRQSFDLHKDPVADILWQSDQRVVSVSRRGPVATVWLWEAGSRKTLHSYEARGQLAWTANRKLMAWKSGDKTVTFWEADTGRSRSLALGGQAGAIGGLDLSFDGKVVATGGPGVVQFWDAASGKLLGSGERPSRHVFATAFSPDGKALASCATYGGDVTLWKTPSGGKAEPAKPLRILGGIGPAWARWSPDGKTVFAGDRETVRFWNAEAGKHLHTLPTHLAGRDVDWSPDSKQLAIKKDGRVLLWDADSGAFLRAVGERLVWSMLQAWSPDSRTLAVPNGNWTTLWDVKTGKQGATLKGHLNVVTAVTWSPDSKKLATSGSWQDAKVRLWDAGTAKGILLDTPAAPVNGLAWSPDGARLATGSWGKVVLWDARTGKPLPPEFPGHKGLVRAVAWSPDGKALASGSLAGTIRLWDAGNGRKIKEFAAHTGPVYALAWLADGKTLASLGEKDEKVCFWRTDADKPPRTSNGLPGDARFSPDRKLLVSRMDPTRVRIHDTETGGLLGTLIALRGEPEQYLAVSAAGDYRISSQGWRCVVYVVRTKDGQRMLSPDAFEKEYKRKNDPDRIHLTKRPGD
jgi:WD40 repeat protein